MLSNDEQTTSLIAEIYREAIRDKADMSTVGDTMKSVLTTLYGAGDVFETWSLLDTLVGKSEAGPLQQALKKLREQYCQTIFSREVERLDREFQRDPAAGWAAWLRSYVSALVEWRTSFCLTLADAPFPFPHDIEYAERIPRLTRLILHDRWAEVYGWFLFLSRQGVPREHQARLLVIASEIQLYHLLEHDEDRKLLEQAAKLAPKEPRVLHGWSEYWLRQKRIDKAKDFAQQAIDVVPQKADGYVQMGDCYKQTGDLDSAEEQYQKAILSEAGNAQSYRGLMDLCGNSNWFATHKDGIPGLINRILAVEPDEEYDTILAEGFIYEQNKLYEDAYRCYDHAKEVNPSRAGAYTYYGMACLSEATEPQRDVSRDEERFSQAEANFQKALEVAPEALDGYWGMALLFSQQGRWEQALSWYIQSLEHRPQWESIIKERIGSIYRKMGQLSKAEEELARALELAPNDERVIESFVGVGDDYYHTDKNAEAARRVYERLLQTGKPETAVIPPPESEFVTGQIVCPKCHTPLYSKARYCSECGSPIPSEVYELASISGADMSVRTVPSIQRSEHWSRWEGRIREKMVDMYEDLGQLSEAEEWATRELEQEPDNQHVLDALIQVGNYYYQKHDNVEAALRVYEKIRPLEGRADDYENLVGNMRYYREEYQDAADAYRRAIKLENNEAVYHSNLALALKQQHTPGKRSEELEEAIEALGRAVELAPDDEDYASRLKELERQLRFVERYGESALGLIPLATSIYVLMHSDLFPFVLNQDMDNLSEEMFQRIDDMRSRIKSRFGLTIPGVRFSTLEDIGTASGTYLLLLMEKEAGSGVIPVDKQFSPIAAEKLVELGIEGTSPIPETAMTGRWISQLDWQRMLEKGLELWPISEYLLRHLQVVLEENLALYMNHQDAKNLLDHCDSEACTSISDSYEKLTAFTRVLREILGKRLSIAAFDFIAEQFVRLYGDGAGVAEIVEYLASMPEVNKE